MTDEGWSGAGSRICSWFGRKGPSALMGTSSVILLVDDNAAILESTARYLRNRNLEVICSESPFGVPSLMSKHSPAVIVLDVMIPALSGQAIGAILPRSCAGARPR